MAKIDLSKRKKQEAKSKFKSLKILVFLAVLISIGFAFESPVIKSEVKNDETQENLPYDLSDNGKVPIYSEQSISRYKLNNAREQFQQSLEDTNVYTLVGSYYTIKNDLQATLMLNNKGDTITVYPSVYSLAGTKLDLDLLLSTIHHTESLIYVKCSRMLMPNLSREVCK